MTGVGQILPSYSTAPLFPILDELFEDLGNLNADNRLRVGMCGFALQMV